ncbi:MAG: YkgJ family cysteine cluster protein [Methylotenera sp.]|nr:YkgJ family cysteine cluster protein [Oligoflexia bacterium]
MGNGPEVKVDVYRPSTWPKYTKGMCEGCWAGCCTLPVEVSAFDLIRLEIITEDEAASSLKKVSRRLHAEGVIQSFSAKNQLFILEQRGGRDCIFLGAKDRLCTVYEKRPQVCRSFPKIGPKPGSCPQILKKHC